MSDTNENPNVQVIAKEFRDIPVHLIDDPARPMRTDMSRENLEELVRSIKQIGIIEPVIVRRTGERFEVIAGHRRTCAAELAGLPVIPCHIVTVNDDQAEMMKIHENLYRLDISPGDEARHYAALIDKQKLTPVKIAQLINRSLKYVTDRLDILSYDEELRQALDQGLINLSVAKEFARIEDGSKLKQYLRYAVQSGMTAGTAKRWTDELLRAAIPAQQFTPQPSDESMVAHTTNVSGQCFYCMNEVNVLEANIVYVHDECVQARQAIEEKSVAGVEPQG